ncbi:MAG: 50S ribosomal protein L9 [Planctomycetes bacterium]|nr:50S ribosomal protein L9 [Planctomycetota bacterium]
MKLLLCKNVAPLGIVGDVVEVSAGYARNYLLPQRLATEPTQSNMRKLAEARKAAELERAQHRAQLESLVARMNGVEVTIHARANTEGVLYGSVGKREIAHALNADGHPILPDHVVLQRPIRHLDNLAVELRFADDLRSTIKVWVVREKIAGEDDELDQDAEGAAEGREADEDDNDRDR